MRRLERFLFIRKRHQNKHLDFDLFCYEPEGREFESLIRQPAAPFLFRHNCPSPSLRPQAYSLILSRSSKRATRLTTRTDGQSKHGSGLTTTTAWRRTPMPLRGTLRLSIVLLSLVAFSGLTTHPAQADEP